MAISLCGMPFLAFGASLLILQLAGQPRTGSHISYPIKLGAAVCFLGIPVAWILFLIALAVLRG